MIKHYRTDLIRPARKDDDRYFGDVQTQGIIEVVLYADPKSGYYTQEFAKTLKAAKLIDTCKNIWDFLKSKIPYVLDKPGYQWIKSPGRLWEEKAGDCKSYSVFTASILKNLGIPYAYRFASYDPNDSTPTHVYVYVPLKNGKEIIIDAVWSGPFNTEKKFCYKTDYSMAKTYYLGNTANRKPGELRITTPIEELTDAELDLLLYRQSLEIKKMNAGISGIGQYDEALATVNHCLANVHNPDVICAIGEALEDGYTFREAIQGIGASAKKQARKEKRAQKKKETGKTAAGRLLQKVGKGLKAAGKAVVKVVTAPMRLIAKGAMEIYLPKAAPFFLYLFIPNEQAESLPDMMKRKRRKAEKFKNFVVKGLGMKEAHFMKIIGNALEKKYKMPPAQYLAEKLKTRVSGIGNPKARERAYMAGISGPKEKQRKAARKKQMAKERKFAPKAASNFNSTLKSPIIAPPVSLDSLVKAPDLSEASDIIEVNTNAGQQEYAQKRKLNVEALLTNNEGLNTAVSKFGEGNIIGGAIAAITWLISKISALFKGEKMEPISADDFPDVERDAANAFEYRDMVEDFSNLNAAQKEQVKNVATELIARDENKPSVLWQELERNLEFLNPAQKKEVFEEIQEGSEALDESEGRELAKKVDDSENSNSALPVIALGVAAIALMK